MRLFAYRLAHMLGCPSVDRMLSEMSSRELNEWLAYFHLAKEASEKTDDKEVKDDNAPPESLDSQIINIFKKYQEKQEG